MQVENTLKGKIKSTGLSSKKTTFADTETKFKYIVGFASLRLCANYMTYEQRG
jgi:hypothetical protein